MSESSEPTNASGAASGGGNAAGGADAAGLARGASSAGAAHRSEAERRSGGSGSPGGVDPSGADAEGSPYLRLPLPLVAGGLFLLLAGLLALGLYANRNLRGPTVVAPTPPAAVAPTATPVPPVAAVPTAAAPGATPTFAPTPVSQIAVSTPFATISRSTVEPAQTKVTSVGDISPTPVATLDSTLMAEVTQAFDRYWQVRSEALLELDQTHLPDVMGGDHLRVFSERIDELRAQNHAIKTDVDHEVHVIQVTPHTAQVADDYISNSVYVDPKTHEPLSEPTSDEIRVLYRLDKSDGTWKVVDSVQAD